MLKSVKLLAPFRPWWVHYYVGIRQISLDVALKLVEAWEVLLDRIYCGNAAMME